MTNLEISKLKHGAQILHYFEWLESKQTLKREKQLDEDSIEVFDYTSHDFPRDTTSELTFKDA